MLPVVLARIILQFLKKFGGQLERRTANRRRVVNFGDGTESQDAQTPYDCVDKGDMASLNLNTND